jgi:hypothetical protein
MDKLDLLKQQKWGTTEERRASMQEQARQFDTQSEAAQLRAALEATRKSNEELRGQNEDLRRACNLLLGWSESFLMHEHPAVVQARALIDKTP